MQTKKLHKSVELTTDEHRAFKAKIRKYDVMERAAEEMNISRSSLERIMLKGKGSPENIGKVKLFIEAEKTKAIRESAL